jgi:predicted RNA-binding protein with TRAM domain
MDIPDSLHTLYTANIEQDEENYHITIPERQIEKGELAVGETYRVAILTRSEQTNKSSTTTETAHSKDRSTSDSESVSPPVKEGETREVEIENLGDQGDGIAKIDRGYVLIVPDTDFGDRVTVEIETVRENVAFATVVDTAPRGF